MQLANAIDKFSLGGGEQDSAASSQAQQASPAHPARSPPARRPLSQQLLGEERPSMLRYDSWHGAEQPPADEANERQTDENYALTSAAAFMATIPRSLMPWATTAGLPPTASTYRVSDTLGMQSFMSADSVTGNASSPTYDSTTLFRQEARIRRTAGGVDMDSQSCETQDARDDASDCGSEHSIFL